MRKQIVLLAVLLLAGLSVRAKETYLYAEKDTSKLYLDIHRAAVDVAVDSLSAKKPTILHVFGGGFKSGTRDAGYLLTWFETLNKNGYNVVAIDYRLGMKGYKMGKGLIGLGKSVTAFYASQQMGVEDVFSAISYLQAHPELGIDVNNLVASGNSAGAIISLACAHAIANGKAESVKDDFRLKGVMSFAGAIISLHGAPKFASLPCPILFFHGLKDNAVAYRNLSFMGKGMWGSNYLAAKLKKQGGSYHIYRMKDRAHEVSSYMNRLWPEEEGFLERNVIKAEPCIIDAKVVNDSLPINKTWGQMKPQEMYNGD